MSRDKQIEEMQKEIIRWGENADKTGNYKYSLSEHLVDKGYRKASEVAREIFAEIEKIAMHGVTSFGLCLMSMGEAAFAELKKKYESEKDNG